MLRTTCGRGMSVGRRPTQARAVLATLAATLLISAVVVLPAPRAGADSTSKLTENRAKAAKVATQVDALKATDKEVGKALTALQANVDAQKGRYEMDRAAATAADLDLKRTQRQEGDSRDRLERSRTTLRAEVVRAYVRGGDPNGAAPQAAAGADVDPATLLAYRALATGRHRSALEEFRAVEKDLIALQAASAAAAKRSTERAATSRSRLASVDKALADQLAYAAKVDDRLNQLLAESTSLAATDKTLSAQLAQEQAVLADRIARLPARPSRGASRPPIVGGGDIVSVGGIEVNRSIASQVQGLLEAASSAGFSFGGGGWRSSQSQIDLRRAHCGSSDYDIYDKPASECSPPTAKPGSSMHEQGLAIDFTCSGHLIQSRSDPCYGWLAGNAGRFGLYNLPSEPWHWSVNGN